MNEKILVLYLSKTGYTEKYANWIARGLQCRIVQANTFEPQYFTYYDTIVFGGGLYALHINGLKYITKNMDWLRGKNIHIFACGATPPRQEDIDKLFHANFTSEEQKRIRFYYFRGGFCYEKLPVTDKVLMLLLKVRLKCKKKMTADEKGMLGAFDKPVDFTDEKNVLPLIEAVSQEMKNPVGRFGNK